MKTNEPTFADELEMEHEEDDIPVDEQERAWERPPLAKPWDPKTDTLYFQQIDIDYTLVPPVDGMPNQLDGQVPLIRMYGATADGHSVCANIYGIIPYFYTPAPNNFREADCELYRRVLNKRMSAAVPASMGNFKDFVVAIDIEQKVCFWLFFFFFSFLCLCFGSPH